MGTFRDYVKDIYILVDGKFVKLNNVIDTNMIAEDIKMKKLQKKIQSVKEIKVACQ